MPETRDAAPLLANLEAIRARIARACDRAGRDPGTVRIVAATKTVGPEAIASVRDAGVRDVGENYVRELRAKRSQVPGIRWHFIGTLQSGSARWVADLADVVETVVPGRAMRRLGGRAARQRRSLPVLVEVDFTGDRAGVAPEAVGDAADEVSETEGLELVGLMTLAPIPSVAEDSRPHFRRLRGLRDAVVERHPGAAELSMGMSLDYEVAVEEGATMVRLGTALFGARPPTEQGRT